MGKATLFLLVTYLFALTTSLYGCLAGIFTRHSLIKSAGSGIGFVCTAATFYGVCSKAHLVTHTVRHHVVFVAVTVLEYTCGWRVYEQT
jgi:hypothetical protein